MISPGVDSASSSCSGVTLTSGRCLSIWLGFSPSTASKAAFAVETTSGCATQVPSKPALASRFLSSLTASIARWLAASSLRDGISAAIPPIANAPCSWQVLTSNSV